MTTILKRLRPLLIGLVAILFTAGIAFAGKPSAPAPGRLVAAEHAGKIVPTVDEDGDEETETVETETEEADEAPEAPDADGTNENCATDPTGLTDEQLAALKHGSVVCWAAHQDTPDGFANHGEWVSSWATKNHGHEESADAAAGTVLSAAPAHGKGKPKNH